MARTILVVEDEPTLRETLTEALETDGFRVMSAADGREALIRFRSGRPDLVLLDVMLPELSGMSARIRALFRRSEQAVAGEGPPAVIDLGAIQADLGGHRLLRDGEVLPIKPRAFELLAFLIRHPGQVFTRDQLLEHVWGYDYGGGTRTVDVHVHWLRSRIEADPGNPVFIHTVRGVGYLFRRPS
jgi:two-component system OmpR family response regulator